MDNIELNKKPSKFLNLWYIQDDDKIKLLTITNGIVEINSSAAFIWNLIDGKRTIAQISEEVHNRYKQVSINRICQDVLEIVQSFVNMEVVSLSWHNFSEEE